MRRRAKLIAIAVAGFSVLAVPAAQGADELGLNKAKSATARYAAQQCQKDPECVKSDARYCDRQNDWKLICDAFLIRRVDTDRVQCRQQVVVSASPSSPAALRLNPRALRCDG